MSEPNVGQGFGPAADLPVGAERRSAPSNTALLEIRLRPTGPWRAGHRTGDRERADAVYHSDALYSAVTQAMGSLGGRKNG